MQLLNLGWNPKPRTETGAELRSEAIRLLMINAVMRGKLSKDDIAEANEFIGDRPLACYAKLARDFADQCAVTSNVQASELFDLISKGPAAALFKLVADRKAAWEAFQQTAYSQKIRDLTAQRDAANEAFAAVEHDEDVTPQKKRRLLAECEAPMVTLNALMNSRDPELVAYRDKAKQTADQSMNELKWESFAI